MILKEQDIELEARPLSDSPKQPLVPLPSPTTDLSHKGATPKVVHYKLAIITALMWGTANVTFSYLDGKGFAVSCLSWTGFIMISLMWKVFELS